MGLRPRARSMPARRPNQRMVEPLNNQQYSTRGRPRRSGDRPRIGAHLRDIAVGRFFELPVGLEVHDSPAGEVIDIIAERKIDDPLNETTVVEGEHDRCFAPARFRLVGRSPPSARSDAGVRGRRRRLRPRFLPRWRRRSCHARTPLPRGPERWLSDQSRPEARARVLRNAVRLAVAGRRVRPSPRRHEAAVLKRFLPPQLSRPPSGRAM